MDTKQREAESLPLDIDALSIQLQTPVEIMRHWGLQGEEYPEEENPDDLEIEVKTRGRHKLPIDENGNYDSSTWLKQRTHKADIALMKAVEKGNTNALKLFKQLTGELIEKQEVKFGLNADETARRNLEADRAYDEWLNKKRGTGQGVEALSKTPRLLPDQIRRDSKQEHGKDS